MAQARDAVLSPGSLFQERYEILGELGEGGSGRVYQGRQLSTGQLVAVKLLRLREEDSSELVERQRERFRREARLCAELSHPNIVRLMDSGETSEQALYAVFECVEGLTLQDVLSREGSVPLRETLHLMTQVLDALACAHRRGVIHRDLKPANIMVTSTGARRNAMVLDFGLGGFVEDAKSWALPRITLTREFMGTPYYASPEQLRGEPATPRSDLYAWGLIFLECLTGTHPMGDEPPAARLQRLDRGEPLPMPEWLRSHRLGRLLTKVTAPESEKRDLTLEGLLQTLEQVGREGVCEPQRAAVPSPDADLGERRQVTIVSCRLVLRPLEGDTLELEERDALLRSQQTVCAEVARRHGGDWVAAIGDRALLQFGYPKAREDDARRALRMALELSRELGLRGTRLESERRVGLDVRIGVHSGMAVVREVSAARGQGSYELLGAVPEVAIALDGLAGAGEVLASADTRALVRAQIEAERVGKRVLGPLSVPIDVFRVLSDAHAAEQAASESSEAKLVGRSAELEQLLEAWRKAEGGEARCVLVMGDPGIGKSRLLRELRRSNHARWLECRCTPETRDSPLRPVVELLAATHEPIETILDRHGFDLEETAPLLRALLMLPGDGPAPALSRERLKDLALDRLVALMLKMAEIEPLLMVVEDLQWADPTTLEWLGRLVQELRTAQMVESEPRPRLLVVFSARSEFEPPWGGTEVSTLPVPRLSREEVETLVRGVAGGGRLPAELLDRVIGHADGVPLFVEEVTRVLMQRGAFALQEGAAAPDTLEVPSTLRSLLTARLDGLSPDARETAQLAAAIGREFSYELMRAISPKEESLLREDLKELGEAGLLFRRRGARGEQYLFKHALVRDAAYESMLRSKRRAWHWRIAHALVERFPQVAASQPELVALHFSEAGELDPAAEHWSKAGHRAVSRGNYAEAIRYCERGVALLRSAERTPARLQLELQLTECLGSALFSTRGYGAPEVATTFARAGELCREVGGEIPLRVLYGIWAVQITRSDPEATGQLVPLFQARAERLRDPVSRLTASAIVGMKAFLEGEFEKARTELERGLEWYDTPEFQSFVKEYGYDTGMYTFAFLMCSLFCLGHTCQAVELRDRMLALAEKSRNPYSLGIARSLSISVSKDLGDIDRTLELALAEIARCSEQKLYNWVATAMCTCGWAMVKQGEAEAGIERLGQGLNLCRAVGLRATFPWFLAEYADACRLTGRPEEGLAAVDEGLTQCEGQLDRWCLCDLLRIRGELLQAQGDEVGAESFFQRSLDLARAQEARSFELRAAASLAGLMKDRERSEAGRALLAPVCAWFAEDAAGADVRDARELLATL